ncbi:hypothetical protein [Sphingomonas sp. ID0503]|uniref:hypothetical protein n=1 Tax=Sphingomonas sp. ID0503 TaxID=3399691 RepID=UPI003AFA3F99
MKNMIASLVIACMPVAVTSATAFVCQSGEKVILADIRASASDQVERDRQRAALASITLNKRLTCETVEQRATVLVGRCTSNGQDIALQHVANGNAQLRTDVQATKGRTIDTGAPGRSGLE